MRAESFEELEREFCVVSHTFCVNVKFRTTSRYCTDGRNDEKKSEKKK